MAATFPQLEPTAPLTRPAAVVPANKLNVGVVPLLTRVKNHYQQQVYYCGTGHSHIRHIVIDYAPPDSGQK